MRFYVDRIGSNAANQSGEHRRRVAEVEASDEPEACRLVEQRGLTIYNNQRLEAEDAELADAADAAVRGAVTLIGED